MVAISLPTFAANPLAATSARPHRSQLILRFVLVNMTGTALVGAAWHQGWVQQVLAGDSSGLGLTIIGTFLAGTALCAVRVAETSRELDQSRAALPDLSSQIGRHLAAVARAPSGRASLESALKLRLASRIAPVRHIAGSLVLLGLIGTVLGFIMALGGVDAGAAGDVAQVGRLVAGLIEGMGVALYTTLIGAALNVWLMSNYRLLEHGTVTLLASLLERGASHAAS